LVEPDAGAGRWAGGLSGWIPTGAALAFGQGAALFRGAGRWFHAAAAVLEMIPEGLHLNPQWTPLLILGGYWRGASAGAYAGAAFSLWRRDAYSRVSFGEDELLGLVGIGNAYFLRRGGDRIGVCAVALAGVDSLFCGVSA